LAILQRSNHGEERTMSEVKKSPDSTFDRIKQRLSARVIVAIVIVVLAVILIAQNTHDVQFHLFFWHINRPMWLMWLIFLAAGFVIGSIYPWFNRRRKSSPDSASSKN
jgi:uncharacterized integral membrane protein